MEVLEPVFSFMIGSFKVDITPEIIVQWVIIALLVALGWWLTRDLKVKPGKKQAIAEIMYNGVKNLITDNVGAEYSNIVPFVGSMAIFILVMNLTGLVGVVPPTNNYSVAVGMAIVTFVTVQGYAIRRHGTKSYLCGYFHPIPLMLPLNIIERFMLPVSLSLRLFGNILAATFIVDLIYENLSKVCFAAQIGIPVAFHGYFDLFDGLVQAVIFIMLTMINIKIVSEE